MNTESNDLKDMHLDSDMVSEKSTQNQAPLLRPSIEYGVILGVVGIIIGLVFDVIGVDYDAPIKTVVSYVAMISLLFWAIKNYRDKKNNGKLSFGRGVGLGTLSYVWYGVISSIFVYIYMTYISPEILDFIYESAYNEMEGQGLSEAQIEQSMEIASFFMSPTFMSIATLFGAPFFGALISLIIAAILKKD